MRKKMEVAALVGLLGIWLLLAVAAWLHPSRKISDTERRELAQFPTLTPKTLLSGKFAGDFEKYSLDQFPFRDSFRRLKATTHYGVMGRRDNNGIYLVNGSAAKLEYPLNRASVSRALTIFQGIRERYLDGCRIFTAVVPDKGCYLAAENGYPAMDYAALFQMVGSGMPYASYVNLTDCLSEDSYYRTDPHWRQETLLSAAKRLCAALEIPAPGPYAPVPCARPFYGAYYGQAALPMASDTLFLLESEMLSACRVYNYETDTYAGVYDMEKLAERDPYEVFLSGSVSLLRLENPQAETDRELIVFRDSFASPLIPLLAQGYKSIYLVDVRYLSPVMLGRFLDFHGQDVLFLYSTLVLNNSTALQAFPG